MENFSNLLIIKYANKLFFINNTMRKIIVNDGNNLNNLISN